MGGWSSQKLLAYWQTLVILICDTQRPSTHYNIHVYLAILCSFQRHYPFINPTLSPTLSFSTSFQTSCPWVVEASRSTGSLHWLALQLWPFFVQHPAAFSSLQYTHRIYNPLPFPTIPLICEFNTFFDTATFGPTQASCLRMVGWSALCQWPARQL